MTSDAIELMLEDKYMKWPADKADASLFTKRAAALPPVFEIYDVILPGQIRAIKVDYYTNLDQSILVQSDYFEILKFSKEQICAAIIKKVESAGWLMHPDYYVGKELYSFNTPAGFIKVLNRSEGAAVTPFSAAADEGVPEYKGLITQTCFELAIPANRLYLGDTYEILLQKAEIGMTLHRTESSCILAGTFGQWSLAVSVFDPQMPQENFSGYTVRALEKQNAFWIKWGNEDLPCLRFRVAWIHNAGSASTECEEALVSWIG